MIEDVEFIEYYECDELIDQEPMSYRRLYEENEEIIIKCVNYTIVKIQVEENIQKVYLRSTEELQMEHEWYQEEEKRYVVVTREMALDAGMPEIEGVLTQW